MVDVAFSEKRLKRWDFNKEPVLSDWFQVYIKKGSKIQSIVDLMGKKVAVLDQSVQHDVFISYMGTFGFFCDIIPFPDYKKAFKDLSEGKIDACIVNRFYGAAHIEEYNLKETGIIFHPTKLHYAAPKGVYPEILNAIDKNLIEFKKNTNSVYYQSVNKWFGGKIQYKMPEWLKKIIFLLIFSIIIFITITLFLRYKVKTRTAELVNLNKNLEIEIKERIHAEKELEKHRNHLEELVKKRTKELEEANKELESFSYSVSHDLKTPLRIINGFANILLKEQKNKLNENGKKHLNTITRSVDKMNNLITDLLSFSKTSRKDIKKAHIDINPLIKEVYNELIKTEKKKNIDFILNDIIDFNADIKMIKQVFTNLISNALKFTRNNKKIIIEIGSTNKNKNIIYYVKDNGVGFDDKYSDKLFGVFQRLHGEN